MKEKSFFLHHLGESSRIKVLHYLITHRDSDHSLTDLLQAGVSWGTLNQLIPNLLKLNIIIKTRKIGRATLYQINPENIAARQLIRMYDHLHYGEYHDEHHDNQVSEKLFYVG